MKIFSVTAASLALLGLTYALDAQSAENSEPTASIDKCNAYGDDLVKTSGSDLAEIGESPVDIRRTVEYYCMMGFRAASDAKSPQEIEQWRIASLRSLSGVNVERDKYKTDVINNVAKMASSYYNSQHPSQG